MHIVFEWTITHLQTSHHAITTHTLIVLAEVYLVTKYWSYFLIELSFAKALEEVATRVAEEAWLYNEDAFDICFDYIHWSNLSSYIRFFENLPSMVFTPPSVPPFPGDRNLPYR